jgi:hypothetical protein
LPRCRQQLIDHRVEMGGPDGMKLEYLDVLATQIGETLFHFSDQTLRTHRCRGCLILGAAKTVHLGGDHHVACIESLQSSTDRRFRAISARCIDVIDTKVSGTTDERLHILITGATQGP